MKKIIIVLIFLSFFLGFNFSKANATLLEHGIANEMFYDSITGLYWYDPVEFLGWSQLQIENFINNNPTWSYATIMQLYNLKEGYKTALDSWFAIGSATNVTIRTSGYEEYWWEGWCYDSGQGAVKPWSFATSKDPNYPFDLFWANYDFNLYGWFSDANAGGAWLVSSVRPTGGIVPEPSTILLFYFGMIGLSGVIRRKK